MEGHGGSELVAMARRVCDNEAGSDVARPGSCGNSVHARANRLMLVMTGYKSESSPMNQD